MSSATLPRRNIRLDAIRKHENNQPCHTDDEDFMDLSFLKRKKPKKAYSCDQSDVQSSSSTTTTMHSNRFKHLCSRLKHHLTINKEQRTRSEETSEQPSNYRVKRMNKYESISSSNDESNPGIQWPDFEKVYESIPSCLINALPGLDDLSYGDSYDTIVNKYNYQTDQNEQLSMEYTNLFHRCKRGQNYRRNAICQKVDKSQYNGQLDVFIQQLMIEKLMRTWT